METAGTGQETASGPIPAGLSVRVRTSDDRCLQKFTNMLIGTVRLAAEKTLNREDAKIAKTTYPTFAFLASSRFVLVSV